MKTIHLFSGGIDSTVLLYDLLIKGDNVSCVLFRYGQKHVRELDCAKYFCRKIGVPFNVLEIPNLFYGSALTDGNGSNIVPNRNMVMLSMACAHAITVEAHRVTIGCNADDANEFPDCRFEFIHRFNRALHSGTGRSLPEVEAPYLSKTKQEIVAIGRKLEVPLQKTWSCYKGGSKPCNKCAACQLRRKALSCLK